MPLHQVDDVFRLEVLDELALWLLNGGEDLTAGGAEWDHGVTQLFKAERIAFGQHAGPLTTRCSSRTLPASRSCAVGPALPAAVTFAKPKTGLDERLGVLDVTGSLTQGRAGREITVEPENRSCGKPAGDFFAQIDRLVAAMTRTSTQR